MEEYISKIAEIVKEISKDNEVGHDFLHVLRVRDLALFLCNDLDVDVDLVEMVALLHDVEDHKLNSKKSLDEILDEVEISKEYKKKIKDIVPYLSFSKYRRLEDDFPLEGKIVSDADRLDAIGAIGVARAFSYGGFHSRKMYDDEKATIKHFDDKLLVLDQYLYLDKSKEIAKNRMKFLKSFYDEFNLEIKGKDYKK